MARVRIVDRAKAFLAKSELARNTLWMTGGSIVRVAVQALYFVLLARALRPEGYGAFIGTIAAALVIAPFASLGSGALLVKHVARDATRFSTYWANTLLVTALSGTVLFVLAVLVAAALSPSTVPLGLVAFVACSEFLFARFCDLAAHAFMAVRQLKWTTAVHVLLVATRLLAIVVLTAFIPRPSPLIWSGAYLASTIVAAALSLLLVRAKLSGGGLTLSLADVEIKEGLLFAISQSAVICHNYIDKSLLSRLSGVAAAGIYAAAYRIIDVAFAPLSALLASSYARYFQRGADGLSGALDVSKRLLPLAWTYAILCAAALWLSAPLVPTVLGESYAETADALRWLALLPLLRVSHFLLAEAMSGSGYVRARCWVQVLVALVNIALNVWLMPHYSWHAAVMVALASDALLCIGLLLTVRYLQTHELERSPC